MVFGWWWDKSREVPILPTYLSSTGEFINVSVTEFLLGLNAKTAVLNMALVAMAMLFAFPLARAWYAWQSKIWEKMNWQELYDLRGDIIGDIIRALGSKLYDLRGEIISLLVPTFIFGVITMLVIGGAAWLYTIPMIQSIIENISVVAKMIYPYVGYGAIAIVSIVSIRAVFVIWRHEREAYTRANFGDRVARGDFQVAFERFFTAHYRRLFVEELITRRVDLTGAWPNGKIPNVRNDAASIMLAQWEERNNKLN